MERVLHLGLEFRLGKQNENQVFKYMSNETLKYLVEEDLPRAGKDLESIFLELEKIADASIAQFHEKYMAFPDTANSLVGVAADILIPLLNQNMIAVDRSAPIATFIEIQLLQWIREVIGFEKRPLSDVRSLSDVGGMWTSGGNMSNHIAVLTALHAKFPQLRKDGLCTLKTRPMIVLSRDIAHFSFKSAAIALGLGEAGILWAKTKGNFNSDADDIRSRLDQRTHDQTPFMLVCVAGNCRTTSIDNILEMRKIADEYRLWLHVDACHGGNLLFSEKEKTVLEGICLADSVSIDPHKGLFLAYPSSYVIFKEPADMTLFSRYPNQVRQDGIFDLGLITPFYGSRGFESMKLWLLIKTSAWKESLN